MSLLLHNVFDSAAARSPDAVAILAEDGRRITYAELDRLARRYQARIAATMRPDASPFVGVLATVNAESIAAVIAALRLGLAYVPLDEASPDDRLHRILDATGPAVVVADPEFWARRGEILSRAPALIRLSDDGLEGLEDNPLAQTDREVVSDDLAYVLHSSGSTGTPKGIMLSHRNARTFVDWMQLEFQPRPGDVVMSRAPWKFDLSVWDVFNTLGSGATLACFDWHRTRAPGTKHRAYVDFMRSARATMLYTTPSTLVALLNHGGLAASPPPLRTVMFAGEPFPPAQLRRLAQALPETGLANIYGPTETNIVTCHWVEEPVPDEPVPLGRVVADAEILVVDPETRQVCAPNEVGELWCRGGTVTLGYLGQPELTRQSEAQSPIHPYPARCWRTGDYGFRDGAGVLHYRGRRDHQVKVRGYRIELGEIEHALAEIPGLDTGVVTARKLDGGDARLVCHFTTLPGVALDETAIASALAARVPVYMLPHEFRHHESLPQTSSGKVDRMALSHLP